MKRRKVNRYRTYEVKIRDAKLLDFLSVGKALENAGFERFQVIDVTDDDKSAKKGRK